MIVEKYDVIKWFNRIANKEKAYKEFSGLFHDLFHEPEREEVFDYVKSFLNNQLHLMKERNENDYTEESFITNDEGL